MKQFLFQLVALSYNGDFRMLFGEDKNKIRKIAEGNALQLEDIYLPMLKADSRILVRGYRIEQVCIARLFELVYEEMLGLFLPGTTGPDQ